MVITERDRLILWQLSTDEWVRPMDVGGTDASHHSATLKKLVRYGLVEQRRRAGHCRPSYQYRKVSKCHGATPVTTIRNPTGGQRTINPTFGAHVKINDERAAILEQLYSSAPLYGQPLPVSWVPDKPHWNGVHLFMGRNGLGWSVTLRAVATSRHLTIRKNGRFTWTRCYSGAGWFRRLCADVGKVTALLEQAPDTTTSIDLDALCPPVRT